MGILLTLFIASSFPYVLRYLRLKVFELRLFRLLFISLFVQKRSTIKVTQNAEYNIEVSLSGCCSI